MIDVDYGGYEIEKLIEKINLVLPSFKECAKIVTCSTSSNIIDADGNPRTKANNGYHIYIMVKHGSTPLCKFVTPPFRK